MKDKTLISFVVPCFNEQENVDETFKQLSVIAKQQKKYQFEFVFVDNGSSDHTRQHIEQLADKDSRMKGIFLSRNFGPEASGIAGLEHAKGDVIIISVCDLQDPLELIPEYIAKWEKGSDLVIGIYTKNQDAFVMATIRKLYYKIFKRMANITIPINSSGICLYSRPALDAFLSLQERFRSSLGLRAWIGFKTEYITYERRERKRGKSSYNVLRYLQTAERSFFGFSYVPLNIIIYLSAIFLLVSFLFFVGYLISVFFHVIPWNQTTVIVSTIILFGSIQLLAISVIGKYIQVIVEETKKRPHYIIETIYQHAHGKVT